MWQICLFLSYHLNTEETIKNAGRLIQEGHAHAVKLEGGMDILDHVKAIVKAQIPVMGHIGLTPQSVNVFGGFKVQGKSKEKKYSNLSMMQKFWRMQEFSPS